MPFDLQMVVKNTVHRSFTISDPRDSIRTSRWKMSKFVINFEKEKHHGAFPFKMRMYANCRKEKFQIVLMPTRSFWNRYNIVQSNEILEVELDFRILTNLPHFYSMASDLNLFDVNLDYPIKKKNKQILSIPNNSNLPLTRNDKMHIKITFYRFPDVLNICGKPSLSPSFRKKCF